MQAAVHVIHQSGFCRISDFRCACLECSTSRLEFGNHFSICFVRQGYFEQHVFRRQQEMHAGRILVSKPGIEYRVRHMDNQPDICTSLNFSGAFYEQLQEAYAGQLQWFFRNPDLQSLLLSDSPEAEYLHRQILAIAGKNTQLEMDELVIQVVENVLHAMGKPITTPGLPAGLKNHHLPTVEKARDYVFRHFAEDISLQALAEHCCVSLFHFGRIFKSILHTTPHQYLTNVRIQHAKFLLQTTGHTVSEVAFQSGFNSVEHFVTAFRKVTGTTPTACRQARAGSKPISRQFGRVSHTW